MILHNDGRQGQPLLAPQFLHPGPYAPGSSVDTLLPLRNESHQPERNLRLRFVSDSDIVSIHPEEVEIERIGGKEQIEVKTTVHVLPDVVSSRTVKVWAELVGNTTGHLRTATAIMQINAVAKISLDMDEQDVIVRNEGDAPTSVQMLFDPVPLGEDGRPRFACTDQGIVESFTLAPRSSFAFSVGAYTGIVSARTAEGERTVLRCDRVQQTIPAIDASFTVSSPPDGARHGDLSLFTLDLHNLTGVAAHDIVLDLALPGGLKLVPDLLTLNDVRVLQQDTLVADDRAQIRCGRLAPNADSQLRGAFTITADRYSEEDVLDIDGFVTARAAERVRVRAGILLDREPQFSRNTTYLDDIEQMPDGRLRVRCIITNSEPQNLQNSSVNIRLHGARISQVREFVGFHREERTLPLQPSISDGPMTRVSLGSLERDSRRELEILLEPTPTGSMQHHVGIAAVLLVDSYPISLGEHTKLITGRVNLTESELSRRQNDESPLRLGMPVTINLQLKNSGSVPAHDVRVALRHPEQIDVELPVEREGRWYRLIPHIPPGMAAGLPITLSLIEPINQYDVEIVAEVDAQGSEPVTLRAIRVRTPASPCVELSPVVVTSAPAGLLNVGVRVSNVGDGVAENVSITIPMDDHPLPRTAKIDEAPVQEEGTLSPLVEGMVLGTLVPGTYRDVYWMVAPGTGPYQAHVSVRYDGAEEVRAVSQPTTQHIRAGFAVALPDARRIDTTRDTRPTLRPQGFTASVRRSTIEDPTVDALRSGDETRALGAAVESAPTLQPVGEESCAGADTRHGAPSPQPATSSTSNAAEDAGVELHAAGKPVSSVPAGDNAHASAASAALADSHREAADANAQALENGYAPADAKRGNGEAVDDTLQLREPQPANAEDAIAAYFANKPSPEPTAQTAVESVIAEEPVDETTSFFTIEDCMTQRDDALRSGAQSVIETQDASEHRDEDDLDPHNRRAVTATMTPAANVERVPGPNMDLAALFLPEVQNTSLQGWKHVLASRALLPVTHPAYTTAETGLNELLGQIISLGEDTRPDDPFVRRIEDMDSNLLADVRESGLAPIYDESYAQLDAYIVRALPDNLDDVEPAVAEAYHDYVDTLRFYWSNGVNSSWTNDERRANLSSRPNMTLDQALEAFCDALGGEG